MSKILQAALGYALRGLAVFPVAQSKAPLTPHGFKDASTDAQVIEAWWKKHPRANVGIAVPRDMVIVDVDEGGFEAMRANDLSLPSTQTARTSKGEHLWYQLEDDDIGKVSPKVRVIDGVDLRAHGSYVVAPPSLHSSGFEYAWVTEGIVTPAPEWVVAFGSNAPIPGTGIVASAGLDGSTLLSDIIPHGQQDITLFRYACQLRHRGVAHEEAVALVEAACRRCERPPRDPRRVALTKVENAWKYAAGKVNEPPAPIKVWSMKELLSADLPEPVWVVPDKLPEGITIVVGRPKGGKSHLLGNVMWAYSTGEPALGCLPTAKGGVLYLDLEQGEFYAQKRWDDLFTDQAVPEDLHIAFEWKRMDEGGLDELRTWLHAHPNVRCVVVDLLSNFWPANLKVQTGQNAYHREYAILKELKAFARELGLALVLVHHTNRGRKDDPLESVSGTNAMTGAVDAVWILHREAGSSDGELYITGKNVPEDHLDLEFTPAFGGWCVKNQEKYRIQQAFNAVPV